MSADKYRIDSHKLHFHVERVSDWLKGEDIAPIYMEASPAGACNHRCTFCGLDFMGYQPRFLIAEVFKERLQELGRLGLKSIMYAGEGEPLLHRDIAELAQTAKESGIDVALTTNGVLLKPEKAELILPFTEWIKVSFNAGRPETYARIHRTKAADFDRVLKNLAAAVEIRARRGYRCTLGLQMILLPENETEAVALARTAREIGLDYLVIKPYSQHPASRTTRYRGVRYEDSQDLAAEVEAEAGPGFNVIFRTNTMKKWDDGEKAYDHCLALPFWSYIDAGGDVWGCSVYLTDERFRYGNIYDQTFTDIWRGERRKRHLRWVQEEMDARQCRVNCRMDEINRYLWELKHPQAHVNFI